MIYGSVLRIIKSKKYKQFLAIEFDDIRNCIDMFHLIKKSIKKIGGISILDEYFAGEYLKRLDIHKKPKYLLIVNIMSNSEKLFSNEKRNLKELAELYNVISLPKESYDKCLEEFWMLRVVHFIIN